MIRPLLVRADPFASLPAGLSAIPRQFHRLARGSPRHVKAEYKRHSETCDTALPAEDIRLGT